MCIYIKYTAFKKSAYAEILYHFNCLAFANTLNMIHLFVNNKHAPSLLTILFYCKEFHSELLKSSLFYQQLHRTIKNYSTVYHPKGTYFYDSLYCIYIQKICSEFAFSVLFSVLPSNVDKEQ